MVTQAMVTRLRYWCQLVLPAVYDDSLSYYELLNKVVNKLNEVINSNNELAGYVAENADAIKELQELFEKFKSGLMTDYYEKQIDAWIQANMERIISKSIRFVMFGINKDGRFVAYVPESWSQIQFDFGAVYGRSDYRRIILRFDAEGNAINNTYPYSLSQNHTINKLIADLETNAKRTDAAYDTLFTNMDEEVKHDYD